MQMPKKWRGHFVGIKNREAKVAQNESQIREHRKNIIRKFEVLLMSLPNVN